MRVIEILYFVCNNYIPGSKLVFTCNKTKKSYKINITIIVLNKYNKNVIVLK